MMAESRGMRRGLGRGLSALMADVGAVAGDADSPAAKADTPRRPDTHLPIEKLRANPNQPRRDFPAADLEELAASIREKGIIQPLLVRPDPDHPGDYQIIAGERRWRAAQRAALHEVPVLIRQLDDAEVLEFAIIENIQRADLNPVEEAQGYRQLMDRFGHTQEQLATALGKSRSHIANLLRLLNLPDEVLQHLREGRLSAGHARALVTAPDPAALAAEVIRRGLSVRQTEALAKGKSDNKKKQRESRLQKDADTRALEQDLGANLGMTVSIDHDAGGTSGRLTIRYRTLDELDELCAILTAQARAG